MSRDPDKVFSKEEVSGILHKARREQLSHGHDWDVADVTEVVMGLLATVWEESHGHCSSIGCPNPYEVQP